MHPLLVAHHFAGADAKHHVMGVVIAPLQKMHVVRRDQADSEILREFGQAGVASMLLLHPVIVHFDEEIFPAENVAIFCRGRGGDVDFVGLQRGIHFAGEATAQADQSRGMCGEKLLVDSRAIMKAVEVRG